MAKAQTSSSPAKDTGLNTPQFAGSLRHAAHLAEQRRMYLGTLHGTKASKRGPRFRQQGAK
jgi:hypothetical protein